MSHALPHPQGQGFPPGMVFPGFGLLGAPQQPEGLGGAPPGDLPEFHFNQQFAPVALPYLQQTFGPVAVGLQANQDEIRQLRSELAEHRQQSASLQAEIQRLTDVVTRSNNPAHDADDEAEGRSHAAGPVRNKRGPRGGLTKSQLNGMQAILRRVITQGCGVDSFQELSGAGLPDQELELVDENWNTAWKPDFTKAWSDARNTVWVEKILNAVMEDDKAQELVSSKGFPAASFNKTFIGRNILSTTWASCRDGAKTHDDPQGAGTRREQHKTRGNRNGRRNRLSFRRRQVAAGATNKKNPEKFQFEGKNVPPDMFTPEVTSDVISDDEYKITGIRPEISVADHKAARVQFECEGIKPFYRHEIEANNSYEQWDRILPAMEPYLPPEKGAKLTARFYAGNNRWDRTTVTHNTNDIPTGLYRCQISKYWYQKLPEWHRKTIRPSPPGWEVDEELESVAGTSVLG